MRSIVLPLVLMASLAGAAQAADRNPAYGNPSYDRKTRTLFVSGDPYYIPPSMSTSRLAGAARVTVYWSQDGGRRVVTRYSAERDDNRP